MINKLVEYFASITPLSKEERSAIAESALIKQFKKGTTLLKEGQLSTETYFVLEGCIQQYSIIDGEEKTTDFFTENQWVLSLSDFLPDSPSTQFWVCVEDTCVAVGNEEAAQKIFSKFPRFETVSRMVIEKAFTEQQRRMNLFITDTPEQRYLKLLQLQPDLYQRIPQYQLASYIGVKPESLSRIRKRILLRNK